MHERDYPTDEELALLVTGQRSVPPKGAETDIAIAERVFRDHLPVAAQVICSLATGAEKETVRLQAAKYVVERIMGRPDVAKPLESDNPYEFLMSVMREPTAAERQDGRSVSRG